jgi:hypothetical protein
MYFFEKKNPFLVSGEYLLLADPGKTFAVQFVVVLSINKARVIQNTADLEGMLQPLDLLL